jgi:CRP-like cAMP-binding protein
MLSEDEIISLLQENETFDGVQSETLRELAQGAVERICEPGETLIEQGVRAGDLFVVIEGEFAVAIRENDRDPENEVARVGHGRVFGEIGAVSGIGATASVRSVGEGKVLAIPGDHFHRVMYHSPRLAESVLRSMSRYLKKP